MHWKTWPLCSCFRMCFISWLCLFDNWPSHVLAYIQLRDVQGTDSLATMLPQHSWACLVTGCSLARSHTHKRVSWRASDRCSSSFISSSIVNQVRLLYIAVYVLFLLWHLERPGKCWFASGHSNKYTENNISLTSLMLPRLGASHSTRENTENTGACCEPLAREWRVS